MKRKQNLQVVLVSKEKIGGNHAFFRDNKASIWKTTPYIALYFTAFWNNCCLFVSKIAWLFPIYFLDFSNPCKDLLFPHSHKLNKNASVLVGTVLKHGSSTAFETI